MKSTILLALALFLASAPTPDSNDIAEMTSNFIVPHQTPGLLASDETSVVNLEEMRKNADSVSQNNFVAPEKAQSKNSDRHDGINEG